MLFLQHSQILNVMYMVDKFITGLV
jgi:hypothetical protein